MKYLTFLIPLVVIYGCKTNQCAPNLSFNYPDSVYYAPTAVTFTVKHECGASPRLWRIHEKDGNWDTTFSFNSDTLAVLFNNPGVYTITLEADMFWDDTVLNSERTQTIEILEK